MTSARFRHKVEFQEVVTVRDNIGGTTETWVTSFQGWAGIEPLTGKEYFEAGGINADIPIRIVMRYRAGVTPKMRIKHGDRVFDIRSVANVREKNRELHLMCVERL